MNQTINVLLAVSEGCDTEAYALRAALEYFGIQTTTVWVARPNDFLFILKAGEKAETFDFLILCFHGDNGRFCMPKISNKIYTKNEPKDDFFTENHITKYANLNGIKVLSTGCTLGNRKMAKAMIKSGADLYIAPSKYIDGNTCLLILINFFFKIASGKSPKLAFKKTRMNKHFNYM